MDTTRLRELAEAATPGEWAVKDGTYAVHQPDYQCWIPQDRGDAAYIAAANPAVILALLDRLEAAAKECEALDDRGALERAALGKADLQRYQYYLDKDAAIEQGIRMGLEAAACQSVPVNPDGWTKWQYPIHRGYRMQCCDCGLVHVAEFDAVKKLSGKPNWGFRVMPEGEFRVRMRMRREDGK